MENWIRNTFDIVNYEGKDFFQYIAPNGKTRATKLNTFLNIFGEVATPPTLNSFKNTDSDNSFGMYEVFEKWQSDGLIE